MKIYLAGPLFTKAEEIYNVLLANELKAFGHTVLLPQEFVDTSLGDIREQCLQHMGRCDIMVAVLDGCDVDSGTAYEIGWWQAKHFGTVLGLRTDMRAGGDSPRNVNAMFDAVDIYTSHEDLIRAIDKL